MKYVPYFIVIIIIYLLIGNFFSKSYQIPKEAIRVRIIANSNEIEDQKVKYNVKNIVENDMYQILKDVDSINTARFKIKESINYLDNDINRYLKKINYKYDFKVNFGYNFFPKKVYKGIEYNEGMYESLVVTLGNGKGDNWWCVLFPPICMIEAENSSNVEYTSLVKDIVHKYF